MGSLLSTIKKYIKLRSFNSYELTQPNLSKDELESLVEKFGEEPKNKLLDLLQDPQVVWSYRRFFRDTSEACDVIHICHLLVIAKDPADLTGFFREYITIGAKPIDRAILKHEQLSPCTTRKDVLQKGNWTFSSHKTGGDGPKGPLPIAFPIEHILG